MSVVKRNSPMDSRSAKTRRLPRPSARARSKEGSTDERFHWREFIKTIADTRCGATLLKGSAEGPSGDSESRSSAAASPGATQANALRQLSTHPRKTARRHGVVRAHKTICSGSFVPALRG
jgi:hypothetical protein